MSAKLYLIEIRQTVRNTFENFFKEARLIGDLEIVDGWTIKVLTERGFKFETLDESWA